MWNSLFDHGVTSDSVNTLNTAALGTGPCSALQALQCLGRLSLPPSRGTLKLVSAHGLSNNNNGDGGCGCGRAQVSWLGLRVGGHPALSLHSSDEPCELSQ